MGSPINPDNPSPTKSPITGEGCYSNNYKDCLPDGYTSFDCNMMWLPDGSQANCIALWEECTGNLSSCCGPAICFGDDNYASCVKPTEPNPPTPAPVSETTPSPTKSCRAKGEACNSNADCCKFKCRNFHLPTDVDHQARIRRMRPIHCPQKMLLSALTVLLHILNVSFYAMKTA